MTAILPPAVHAIAYVPRPARLPDYERETRAGQRAMGVAPPTLPPLSRFHVLPGAR